MSDFLKRACKDRTGAFIPQQRKRKEKKQEGGEKKEKNSECMSLREENQDNLWQRSMSELTNTYVRAQRRSKSLQHMGQEAAIFNNTLQIGWN